MKLKELLAKEGLEITFAGFCECGEMKYDLSWNNKWWDIVHRGTLEKHRPDLLAKENPHWLVRRNNEI